jgi:hypothetical protein
VTHEDRIRALERMAAAARPDFWPTPVPPMALALGVIAETLLERDAAPRVAASPATVGPPKYTPAELLAIEAGASREGSGPILYPDAARPLEFVAALMACGITVEIDAVRRTVTASAGERRQLIAWQYLDAFGRPLHRLAAEIVADFRDGGAK